MLLIEELLLLDSFTEVLLNPYGNYVIQKALEEAPEEQQHRLLKVGGGKEGRKLSGTCRS